MVRAFTPHSGTRVALASEARLSNAGTRQWRGAYLARKLVQLVATTMILLLACDLSVVQATSILCMPSEVQVVLGTPDMDSTVFELSGCRGTSPQSLNISLGGGSASLSVVVMDSWLGTVRIFSSGTQQFTLTVRNSLWAPSSTGQPALLYDTMDAYLNTVRILNTSMVVAQAAAIAAPTTTLLFTTITLSGCSLRSTGWTSLVDIRALSADSSLAMHDVTILSDLGASTGSAARVISVPLIESSTLTFVNCSATITASSVQTSVSVISLGSSGSGGGLQVTSGTWVLNVNRVVSPGTLSMLTAFGLMAVSVNLSRVNFVLNHTVLGNFTRAWTSATMLDIRCTDCPTVNIANNTVHMGAAIAPPETSCTYYSYNYAVAVVFSCTLTNSVALVSDNIVTVLLTSPSTQVCNRNAQFVLFAPAVRPGTSLTITRNSVDAYHNTTSSDNNAPTLMVVFANPSSMGSSLGTTAIDGNRVNVFLQRQRGGDDEASSPPDKNVDVTLFASQPTFDASIVVALNRITANENPATSVLDQSNDQRVAVCAAQYAGQFTHRVCGNVISIWSFSATVSLLGSSSATSESYMNAGMVVERNVVLLLSSVLRQPSGGDGSSTSSSSSGSSYYYNDYDSAIARVIDRATFYGGIVQHNNVTISGFDYVESSFVCNAKWHQNYSASPSGSGGSRWQAPTRVWNNTMDIVNVRSNVYTYVLQWLTVISGAFGEVHENRIRVAHATREDDDDNYYYEADAKIVSSVSLVPTNNIGATAIQLYVTNNAVENSDDAASMQAYANMASSITGSSSANAASIVTIAYNAVVVRGRSETTSGPSTYHVGQRRAVDCAAVADADAAIGNKGAAIVGARMLMCNNTMLSVGRDTAIGLTSTMCNWCSTGTVNGSILTVRDNVVDAVSAYRVEVSWCSGCITSSGVANVTGNVAYLTEVDSITAVAGAYTGTMASPTTAGGVRTYLVAQNSVEGFASSQRAMPAVGDRLPSTSGYDNNCHQLPTVNPLVRAWYAAANATLVAVSVVCDNHIYAMDTRSSLSVNLISYASFQLQTSGASEGPALYVIDNLIRVTGGAPAVTVRWANSVNFNSYGTISQQALWSFVLASNTALVSNVPSVSGDLFYVSVSKSTERSSATHFIGGNMMVVVGTPAYPLTELRSMPSYAASLDCPTITTAVRSVQCNNTIVAWNISDAGSSTMLVRAQFSGSSTAVYQNFDTIVVANNSVGMYHLQRANVIMVGTMQLSISGGHIDVTDNVARIDNISSSVSAVMVRYLTTYTPEATFVALNRIAMHTGTPSSSGQPQDSVSSCAALSASAPKRSLMRVVRNVVEGSNIPTSAAITAIVCQWMYMYAYSSVTVARATYVCANAILIMGGPRYAPVAITVVSYASVSQSNSTLFVTGNDVLVNASNSSGSMITPSSSSMSIALVSTMSFDSSYSSSASLTGPKTAAITDNRVSICGILPATVLISLVGFVNGNFYYATNAAKSLSMLVALNNVAITDDVAATPSASLVAASTVRVTATAVSHLIVSQTASMVGVYAQVSVYANNVTINSVRISTAMMTFVGTATLSSVSSRLAVEGNALYVSCASSVVSVRGVGVGSFTARTSSLSLLANTVVVDTSASPLLAAAATTPRAGDAVVVSIAFCGSAFPMTPQQGSSSSDVLSITILQNVVRVVNAAPRVAVALANAPVSMATTVDMCVACRVSWSTTASAGSGQSTGIVVAQNEFYFRTTVAAVANRTTSPTSTTPMYVGSPLFSVSLCRLCELLTPSSPSAPTTVSLSVNKIVVDGGAGFIPLTAPDPTSAPTSGDGGEDGAFAGSRVRIVLCDTCTIAYNHSLVCASNEIMAANCSAVVASLVDVVSVTPSASSLPTHNASVLGFGINVTANVLVMLDTNSTTVVLLRLPWRVPTTIGFRVLVAANSIQATATSAVLGVLQQKLQQQQRPVWALNVTLAHVLGVLVPESKLEVSMNRVVATAAQPAAPASVLGALLRIDSESSQSNDIMCCVMSNHDGNHSYDTAQAAMAAGMCTSSSSTFTARVLNTTLSSTGGADANSSAGSGSGGGGLALLDITTLASMPVIPPHTHGLTIIAAFNNLSQWPGATTPHPHLVKLVVGSDTHRCLLSATASHAPVFGINASAVHEANGSTSPRQRTEVVVDSSSVLGTIFLGCWCTSGSPAPLIAIGHSLSLNVSASSIRGIELFGTLDDLRVDVRNNSHLTYAAGYDASTANGNDGGAVCNASQRSCGGAAALTIAAGGMVSNIAVTIRNSTFGDGAACAAISCGGGIVAVKDNATLRHATVHVAASGGFLRSSRNSGGGGGVLLDVAAANIVENVSMVVERTSLMVLAEGGGSSSSSGGPPLAALAHRWQLLNVVLNVSGSTITAVGVGATAGGGGNPAQPSSSIVAFGPLTIDAETNNVRVMLDNTTLIGYTYVAQWLSTATVRDMTTLGNTLVASACIRWGTGDDMRGVAPRSATPGAWRAVYQPQCTSTYLDGATCPCTNQPTPSVSASASTTLSTADNRPGMPTASELFSATLPCVCSDAQTLLTMLAVWPIAPSSLDNDHPVGVQNAVLRYAYDTVLGAYGAHGTQGDVLTFWIAARNSSLGDGLGDVLRHVVVVSALSSSSPAMHVACAVVERHPPPATSAGLGVLCNASNTSYLLSSPFGNTRIMVAVQLACGSMVTSIDVLLSVQGRIPPLQAVAVSVGVASSIVGGLTGSFTTASTASRVETLQRLTSCTNPSVPGAGGGGVFKIMIGADGLAPSRGALASGCIVLVGALLLAVASVGCVSTLCHLSITAAGSMLHVNGVLPVVCAVVIPSTAAAAVSLVTMGDRTTSDVTLGASGLLFTAAQLLWTCWQMLVIGPRLLHATPVQLTPSKHRANVTNRTLLDRIADTNLAQFLKRLVANAYRWRGDVIWKGAYQLVLEDVRCMWAVAVDCVGNTLIGIVGGMPKAGRDVCTTLVVLVMTFYAVQLVLLLWWKPMMSLFMSTYVLVTALFGLSMGIAVLASLMLEPEGGGPGSEGQQEDAMYAASIFSLMICGVSYTKMMMDVVAVGAGIARLGYKLTALRRRSHNVRADTPTTLSADDDEAGVEMNLLAFELIDGGHLADTLNSSSPSSGRGTPNSMPHMIDTVPSLSGSDTSLILLGVAPSPYANLVVDHPTTLAPQPDEDIVTSCQHNDTFHQLDQLLEAYSKLDESTVHASQTDGDITPRGQNSVALYQLEHLLEVHDNLDVATVSSGPQM